MNSILLPIFLGALLLLSAMGVLMVRQPVHAALFFFMTLLSLAGLYLHLSVPFIAMMQLLVYAGAILVLFIFVVVLFQEAHKQLKPSKCKPLDDGSRSIAFLFTIFLGWVAAHFSSSSIEKHEITSDFGTAQMVGKSLYLNYFFPFEALIPLLLIGLVGILYIGKRGAIR